MSNVMPETAWVVPQLLAEGLILLAGKPKMGKSWLALALALTCALGSENGGELVLGRYPVEKIGVLYLSLEDSPARFQSRVEKLLGGREVPERFGYALQWKPLQAGGLADLETYLTTAPDTRLVVIDTLARVRTPGSSSGNMYQEDYALMGALHEICTRHHTGLILVHHTRKMASTDTFDEVSGSTGLTGAADTSLVLKRERNQVEATLHLTGRDIEEQELALTFSADACTWRCTGNVAERQQSQARQEILDLLKGREAMTPAEIAKELEKPGGQIRSMLLRMVQDGLIVTSTRGHYTLSPSKSEQGQVDS